MNGESTHRAITLAGKARTRRAFLRALARLSASAAGLELLAGCGSATSAPSLAMERVYRVGLLSTVSESGDLSQATWYRFIERLSELGYIEGQNLVVAQRGIDPSPAIDQAGNRLAAAELIGLSVDVLVVRTAVGVRSAMAATSAVPIVMLLNNDPVAAGFVASLARPEGNVTGVTGSQPGTDLKRLQLLAESAPGISKVAVLGDPADPAFWEPAVRTLGIELLFESVAPEGFEATVARIATRADALLVRPGQSAATNQPVIGAATARSALPGISQSRSFVAAGGLMAYEVRAADMDRRAADYVDRLLRGARPADLPVEQATRYDLIVNLATARALGLTLSPAFLARVDEIIE